MVIIVAEIDPPPFVRNHGIYVMYTGPFYRFIPIVAKYMRQLIQFSPFRYILNIEMELRRWVMFVIDPQSYNSIERMVQCNA